MHKFSAAIALTLAVAAPAAAQPTQFQLDDLRMQQQAAERRAVDQANQLQALEGRLRTEQAVSDMAAQRAGARAPTLRYDPTITPQTSTPAPRYPSMPDSALADSNKRVQDAARNRR